MKTILITGCNRGLGLGLVKHLVKEQNPPKHLIATCRNIKEAEELNAVAQQHSNVKILELDVRDISKYDEFAIKVATLVNEDGLNVLYNNAGVSPKFTRLHLCKYDQLLENFKVNTIAPIMLTRSLVPVMHQAVKKNASEPLGANKGLVINVSSILGSIATNTDGGLYPYRCSKAALNMATKNMSIDLKGEKILAVALHPGWVKTDMGGSKAPLDIDTSVSSILNFIKEINEEHNGRFFQYDGKPIIW